MPQSPEMYLRWQKFLKIVQQKAFQLLWKLTFPPWNIFKAGYLFNTQSNFYSLTFTWHFIVPSARRSLIIQLY